MSVVGLDIGDTKCCVALARRGGIDVVLNKESKRETPSVVAFGPKQRALGTDGAGGQNMNIKNTLFSLRRLLGLKFKDPAVQAELGKLPFKVSEAADGSCAAEVMYLNEPATFTIERVIAMLLTDLKATAESEMEGSKMEDCVISIPSYYTEVQRKAMLDAAGIAGLKCLRLMHETTATALAYGIYKQDLPETDPLHVVFVDVGHCALQVNVVAFKKGQLKVLAQGWDHNLGGRLFDEVLFEHFAAEIKATKKIDVKTKPRAVLRLQKEITKVKKILSINPEAMLNIECLMDDQDVSTKITREKFEELSAHLLQDILVPLQNVLTEAGLTQEQIDHVELVGCASRVPAITKQIESFFGKAPMRTLNASEVVSRGCALQCAMQSPVFKVRPFDVIDGYPYNVVFTWDKAPGAMDDGETKTTSVVFPKNNVLPSTKMLTFYRAENFGLEASYSEPEKLPAGLQSSAKIGDFTVGPFAVPANSEDGKAKLKVKVCLDLHGCVSVDGAQVLEEYDVEVPAEPPTEEAAPMDTGDAKDENAAAAANGEEAAPAAMETEKPAAEAPAPTVTKKKVKRTDVPVKGAVHGLTALDLAEYTEKENAMRRKDALEEATKGARNDLEGYILSSRSKLYDQWDKYVAEEARSAFSKQLDTMEDWMYEDGEDETKDVYLAKLAALRGIGDPIEERVQEDGTRGPAAAALKEVCAMYAGQATSADERYAHIEAAEKAKVSNECADALAWLADKEAQQAQLSKTDTPVLMTHDIKKKNEMIGRVCSVIMSKPKPKAPPPEAKAEPKEEEPAADPGAEDGAKDSMEAEPMDSDAGAGGKPTADDLD